MARRGVSRQWGVEAVSQRSGSPQFWVVGAMWGGRDDRFEEFIREGYWILGWDKKEKPHLVARRDRIRPGDFIAIKKISSQPNIEIRAVGIVKRIDPKDHRVFVRWVMPDLNHRVPSRGCYDSIRGDFSPDDEWTQRVFQLEHLEHQPGGGDLPDIDDDLGLAKEGEKRWHLHLVIERNRKNVESKKSHVKKEKGTLDCETCGFNFAQFYGDLGADFCEVHHNMPLSELDIAFIPKLEDLAILCSNCHRIIHKTNPLMTVEDFRQRLRQGAPPKREMR